MVMQTTQWVEPSYVEVKVNEWGHECVPDGSVR